MTSTREWWQDEFDQPAIPGWQVVLYEALRIDFDHMIANHSGEFVAVRNLNGDLMAHLATIIPVEWLVSQTPR